VAEDVRALQLLLEGARAHRLLNQTDDLEGFTVPSWDWIEISANPGY
jgi:hypothetical protein